MAEQGKRHSGRSDAAIRLHTIKKEEKKESEHREIQRSQMT